MAKRRGKTKKNSKKKTSKQPASKPEMMSNQDKDNITKVEIKNLKNTIEGLEGKINKMEEGIQRTKKELDDARQFVTDEIKKEEKATKKKGKHDASEMHHSPENKFSGKGKKKSKVGKK